MVKHLLAYAPAKIIPGILSFLSIFLFARIFTTEEYGNYSYMLSVTTLIITVVFSWIRLSSFRFFNIYTEKIGKNSYLSYIFSVTFWLSVITLTFLLIFSFTIQDLLNNLFFIAVLAGITSVFFEQVLSINRAELMSSIFKRYSILSPVIKFFATLLLVYAFGFREEAIFWATTLSSLTIIASYLYSLKKKEGITIKINNPLKNKVLTKEFLSYGLPLTSSFLFAIIIASSDRILIKQYLGESAVAIYSLSYDTSSFIIGNIFMILNFTFIPVIMKKIDSDNKVEATEKIHKYFWMIIFILVPVSFFLYFFSPYIAKFMLGEKYFHDDTITIIKLMGFGAFLSGIKAYFFDFSFQFGKKTHIQVVPIAIGALTNIALNIWWIPISGITGALYATLTSYLIALVISIILGRKAYPITIDKKSTIYLSFQFVALFILYSLLIKKDTSIYGLIYNTIIFGVVWLIYVLINYKKAKKILM